MRVTFWGVRGSIPTPGPETTRYGGNTLCVAIELPDGGRTLVVDAGSGIRPLGDELVQRAHPPGGLRLDILLSHTHLDHILGLPFFRPLYLRDTRASIYGPAISPEDGLEQVIGGQMSYRYFPVRQIELAAHIRYIDLREGEYDLGDGIRLHAAYLNHPLLCMGYRIEYDGRALCTAFDTEPFRNLFITDPADPRYDELMAREGEEAVRDAVGRMHAFFSGADLLIHDGQFTEAEYRAGRQGWGHSSIEEAIRTAEASGVKRLALVHHDPMRSDTELDRLAVEFGGERPQSGLEVRFAHEGLEIVM
jgi:phosphoribosyl 1,2-cyclic phosphodiesterase